MFLEEMFRKSRLLPHGSTLRSHEDWAVTFPRRKAGPTAPNATPWPKWRLWRRPGGEDSRKRRGGVLRGFLDGKCVFDLLSKLLNTPMSLKVFGLISLLVGF